MASREGLLKEFYRGRAKESHGGKKAPVHYTYTPEGNLELKGKKDEVKSINMPIYRQPTVEEHKEAEVARFTKIKNAQELFESAHKALRDAITSGASTGEIITLNRTVETADHTLQVARFPLRDIEKYITISTNLILTDQPNEVRKMYDVSAFISRPYTLQETYVREGDNTAESDSGIVTTPSEKPKEVILFIRSKDDTNGFLSLDWPVRILINGTSYASAKHALFGELSKAFDNDAKFTQIQNIDDPNEITYTFDESPNVTEEAWNMQRADLVRTIIREKFTQHPELADQLLRTGTATLAAIVIDDILFGIGLSEDKNAVERSNWTGQNLVGQILETVREEIRELQLQQERVAVANAKTGQIAPIAPIIDAVQSLIAAPVDAVQSLIAAPAKRRLRIVSKPLREGE